MHPVPLAFVALRPSTVALHPTIVELARVSVVWAAHALPDSAALSTGFVERVRSTAARPQQRLAVRLVVRARQIQLW